MSLAKTIITILAFMVVTFAVQGLSHFLINADHYAAISFARADPILPMGFAAMIVQALIISLIIQKLWPDGVTLRQSLSVAACFGLFLASYIALAEPAKYAAPSVSAWMRVELLASFIQFASFGIVLWVIYGRRDPQLVDVTENA